MSLVQCPKCDGKISDNSGRCIYCGFAFKICPDCGAVVEKGAAYCKGCGKKFEEAGSIAAAQPAPSRQKIFVREWEESGKCNPYLKPENKLYKAIRIVGTVGGIASFLLLIVLLFFIPSSIDFQTLLFLHYMVMTLFCIFSWLAHFAQGDFLTFLRTLSCAKWLKDQPFDPIENIAACEKSAEGQKENLAMRAERKFYDRVARSCVYLNQFPARKKTYIFLNVLSIILSAVSMILFDVWLLNDFAPVFCRKSALSETISLSEFHYGFLIAAAVIFVVELILDLCPPFKRQCNAWIKEEFRKRNK